MDPGFPGRCSGRVGAHDPFSLLSLDRASHFSVRASGLAHDAPPTYTYQVSKNLHIIYEIQIICSIISKKDVCWPTPP